MKLYKKKFFYFKKNSYLDILLNNIISILLINWIFQGIRGMQLYEFSFRFLFELFFILISYYFLEFSLFVSFLLTHTIFWLFFTHFWTVFRYTSFKYNNLKNLNLQCKKIKKKIISLKYLNEAVIIGSISINNKILSSNSDLDIRIFFSKNIKSYFLLNFFLFYLKFYSFFYRFPLDIYCDNNFKILNKNKNKNKNFVILKDNKNLIKEILIRQNDC